MTTRLYVSGGNLRAHNIGKELNWDNSCGFHLWRRWFEWNSLHRNLQVLAFFKCGLNQDLKFTLSLRTSWICWSFFTRHLSDRSTPRGTMWLPRLALLLLLRFSGVLPVEGINTCQSINLEKQKSRRIEAVRGQILSKLRIRSPPDEDDEPPPGTVPPEVMLLYNSTRELLKERARLAESACERESSEEDYYAKEVQRIDMLPPRTDTSESVGEPAGGSESC